jgi:REP element-mobilizing transposase RayT
VHVTLRAKWGIPSLRGERTFLVLQRALSRATKEFFRVIHFSVQTDHVHLIVEANDHVGLIRGVQGLAVRCAKAINRVLGRRGTVWPQRYHARALRTPLETRGGLSYVLLNFCKHLRARPGVDPMSSAPWFHGWKLALTPPPGVCPVSSPQTWLASGGWLRAGGPIDFQERPIPG